MGNREEFHSPAARRHAVTSACRNIILLEIDMREYGRFDNGYAEYNWPMQFSADSWQASQERYVSRIFLCRARMAESERAQSLEMMERDLSLRRDS